MWSVHCPEQRPEQQTWAMYLFSEWRQKEKKGKEKLLNEDKRDKDIEMGNRHPFLEGESLHPTFFQLTAVSGKKSVCSDLVLG